MMVGARPQHEIHTQLLVPIEEIHKVLARQVWSEIFNLCILTSSPAITDDDHMYM